MDFYTIRTRQKKNTIEVYPEFRTIKSKDLMIRGGVFYAIWDEENNIWSTDEYKVVEVIDNEIRKYIEDNQSSADLKLIGLYLVNYTSNQWVQFLNYCKNSVDNYKMLNSKVIFSGTEIKRKDYASVRLDYELKEGPIESYEELISTLYNQTEREKIEWAIGAIISGDSKSIQKFLVLYGKGGTGKSTILNIVQKLFSCYYATFDAKSITGNNSFGLESLKENPLVAIQHDGDLSKIEDNTRLNSIVSHETMILNEKFKAPYPVQFQSFLMLGTNTPVKITDAKSGLIRRLIDVYPTGNLVAPTRYNTLINRIDFELGAIAHYCLRRYLYLGKNYYNDYTPKKMMGKTDIFYNFVEENYQTFKEQKYITNKQAYTMYKQFCEESGLGIVISSIKFREELKNYFDEWYDRKKIDGELLCSVHMGFKDYNFKPDIAEEEIPILEFKSETSLLDTVCAMDPAQYANEAGTPSKKWDEVTTTLSEINTREIHYVRVPENHIVIDFDISDENGEKSLEKNIEAASKFPPTYAELSKSGKGIHLHYIYTEDVTKLAREFAEHVEIKVFTGKTSLRRKLTLCNDIPISTIDGGLPLKKGDKMINVEAVKSEKAMLALIKKAMRKEIHPGTKPNVDFIYKILQDAYDAKVCYDLTHIRPSVFNFAMGSTNQSDYCMKLVQQMKFKSEESSTGSDSSDPVLVFYDVEVFPNLFVVVFKAEGKKPVFMINPNAQEIEQLLKSNLVGFNCRRYDNHIMYARYLGYNNEQLYQLSQRIINGSPNAMFAEAYNLSYTDVYDFSNKKQSLKKFEIELGIHHQELGFKWDEPVPEEDWYRVAEYCINDVVATEAVFNARKEDFMARKILAELSGLSVNDTTQKHTARIIFGKEKNPQKEFVYKNLAEDFPGYVFDNGVSTYRDEEVGEGGYVYAQPGMYKNVALLDVESMHPTSLIAMNHFGPYTKTYEDIKRARIAIKHRRFDEAANMLNGILKPYLHEEYAESLSYALKIVINIVYGLTSAKFENPFRDPRNDDNIVAKRGSLFMIDLKHAVQEMGYTVAHIKTDSIKIPDADEKIINFVNEFGKKYGYKFEHEATYEKMCLVNDAVYIAKYKDGKKAGKWTATGAQFGHPYVFKKLFSGEEITFEDLCETKSVTSSMYLDFNEDLEPDDHKYVYVGKVGSYYPVREGCNGGILTREKEGKHYAVGGTKGYRWKEAEVVKNLGLEDQIDSSYHQALADAAIDNISKYGDFKWLFEPIHESPCGGQRPDEVKNCEYCDDCPNFWIDEVEDRQIARCMYSSFIKPVLRDRNVLIYNKNSKIDLGGK